ncbi:hypothetical protein TSUD_378460 [Trifolium subterraneum]|uniref:Uncharacterized protein n=1 Tax=Trifolium subterraneum TaxID=3900 RepID=A0A2Z6NQK5_TRISU|nr:hypothetical protein TSUD_378460 [Trifolium subterraneum]
MGNCVACYSQPKKQTRCPLIHGREIGVNSASAQVEKMNTASSKHYIAVRRKVQHGEVYHLAPFLRQSGTTTDDRKMKTRIAKIVVTTQQLELLLSGSKKFQIKTRVASVTKSSLLRRCPKWLPSLPTIPEVQNF